MLKQLLSRLNDVVTRFSKIIIWIVSIIFAVLIIIQIVIAVGVLWLNSDNGQTLVKNQLANAAQETGYNITYDKMSYAFLRGLRIKNFNVSDDGGIILDINSATINPNIIGLGMRYFGLSMTGDKLTLYRLPKSKDLKEGPKQFSLEPFSLPDIYFTSLGIDKLSFEKLHIKKEVFGTEIEFSPSLSSQISIDETIDLNLNLYAKGSDIPWMPESLSLNGTLNPKTLDLILEEMTAENDNLKMSATGDANLSDQGRVNLKTTVTVDDFTPFTNDIKGTAEIEATVAGSFDALALKSKGRIAMPLLNNNDVEDIIFTLDDDNLSSAPLGQITLNSKYKDKPVTLSATFDIDDQLLAVKSITGNAPDLDVTGDVTINMDTLLANGKIKIVAPQIATYSAMADMDIRGEADTIIVLSDDKKSQAVDIKAKILQAQYETMTVSNADVTIQFADINNPWPDSLSLKANNLNLSKDVSITALKADLKQQENNRHFLSLSANGKALQNFDLKGTAILNGLKQSQFDADKIDFKLSSKGSTMIVLGQANLNILDVRVKTQNFNLSSLPVSLPDQIRDLSLSGEAKISGEMSKPTATATIDLEPIKIIKGSRIKLSAKANYDNNSARVDIIGTGDAIDNLNGNIQLPIKISFNPFIFDMPATTPLDGKINMDAQANPLASLILPVGHKLTGNVNANAIIAGTIKNPDITGRMALSKGTYLFNAYGVELFDIDMQADLARDSIQIKTLNADDGRGGKLNGSGRVSFVSKQNTKLDLSLTDFKLLDSDKAKGSIAADLDLQGRSQDFLLSGTVTMGEFNIIIPERFQSKIPTLNIVQKNDEAKNKQQLSDVKLDVDVVADDRIFVRGWGLDAEFGGNLNVGGSLDNPQLDGVFKSRRGRYEEFGRRFTLDRALLRFQGSAPPSPYLDILATTNADDISASVNLSGEVGNPTLALSSVPSLPEDEVMSRILFGENLTNITPFQAIQLKQTLDRFTGKGGGGFNPLGKLRDITGLDDIRVDTNEEGEASVGVGKYLTEDVYLELEKGSGEQSGTAKIQVELTPNVNLESEVGQDAQAGGGVLWRWDY